MKISTRTVGRGNDISHLSIRDIDLSIIAMKFNNIVTRNMSYSVEKKIDSSKS